MSIKYIKESIELAQEKRDKDLFEFFKKQAEEKKMDNTDGNMHALAQYERETEKKELALANLENFIENEIQYLAKDISSIIDMVQDYADDLGIDRDFALDEVLRQIRESV